jgi:Fe-S-cluster containining protein
METGKWVVDCWEGDPRVRTGEIDRDDFENMFGSVDFLRPRASEDRSGFFSREFCPGRCVFLTDDGCELSEDERPYACRVLEPGVEKCTTHDPRGHAKLTCSLEWLEHAELIREALDEADSNIGK